MTTSVLPQLWAHQQHALDASVGNKFESGVHAHATGAGKSRLGHALLRAFANQTPGSLMFWLCEQTSVVRDIFERRGARTGFIVCDLVSHKPTNWWWTVQSSLCWGKPVLVIVNRAFLVSQKRYSKITGVSIGLIIHDECHSGTGKTTQDFYKWLNKHHPQTHIIGLSATPPTKANAPTPPLANVITRFSIYDATQAGIIVPLRIYWNPSRSPLSVAASGNLIHSLATKEGVRKIVVWCGTIEHCFATAAAWQTAESGFRDGSWMIAVDTSRPAGGWGGVRSYKAFAAHSGRGVLFCAAKHREGSDIEGLGMAVFMDGVEKRGAAVFVQCAGRTVRQGKDLLGRDKKLGIVVDLQAQSGLELCDRVGQFLQLPPGRAPWKRGTDGQLNHLTLTPLAKAGGDGGDAGNDDDCGIPDGTIQDLRKKFVREIPEGATEYSDRAAEELELIGRKGLVGSLLRALEVLDLAGTDVPHVTRGSCGSSLVCYLLGISHVDPVAHGISFARFLNEFRDSLPDIDFDFPHNQRADIFLRMALRWPGQVARISNHVHYHEKSAIREALRRRGHKGTMALADQHRYIAGLSGAEKEAVNWEADALDGEFRCYSLHCGGVVYYPEGVPEEALLEGKRGGLLAQIREDKRDIADAGLFKIDVLSSRALSQLVEAMQEEEIGLGVGFDLANPPFTAAMGELLASGRNIGITLAESRLACAEFREEKPTTVGGVAACMALIRPAARQTEGDIVFDDDAIQIIARQVGCTEAEADKFRRGLAKKDRKMMEELKGRIDPTACAALETELGSLALYGFCKAHAMSYAQLVCWLTWCKVEHPRAFWKGALNNCQSSYRPWVHMWEAWKAGVNPFAKELLRNQKSVYTDARRRKYWDLTPFEQLYQHWHWDVRLGFMDGCYVETEEVVDDEGAQKQKRRFRGVIAASRILTKNKVAICVGIGDEYIDVICSLGTFSGAKRFAKGWVNSDGQGSCAFA